MVNKAKKNLVVPSTEAELSKLSDGPEAENESNEHLETAELVNAGWKNYRNESPLFAAVLYLQEKAVTMFATALSPSSLRWELQNVNVEGSSLHHVVSGASRQILNIEHQSARPEYVMIFDGVKKKQFKESIIETLREESSLAPSLVATRAGKREVDDSTCKKKKRTDYLVLGATDEVLIQQAQVLQLKVKHRGSSTRSKYDVGSPELFESFRSLQRQQVIHSIIQRKINLKKHLQNGNIMTIFPLHDEIGCRNIVRHWGYTDDSHRVFQPFAGNSLEEFVFERKKHQYEMLWPLLTYFGEKHTFYYAFVAFYTVWLLPIALLGVICQTLWLVDNASFMPPLFAIVVSIWATLLVERWKRKRSEIQRKFGHFRRNRSEGMPGFYGDFQVESTLQRANATVDVKFPRALQLARIYSGIPLLLIMGVGVVAIFVVVKANIMSSTVVHNTIPWLPMFLVPYVVPLLNAVSMLLLDNLYTRLAQALTKWENHRTVWQFESMLAVKLFWFKFLNAFISLFWIAFVDQNAVALRKQLLIVMGVRQLWNSIMRDLVPTFIVRYRWKQAGFRFRSASRKAHWWSSASHEWYNAELSTPVAIASEIQAPPPFVLLQELMYPHDFLMGKQMEAVLQFGYITMFVSVLPVAPLLALLSNAVAMRLEVLSCTRAKQRPPFESETEVSSFMNILEFMSFAAVAVNCAVLFFTTRTDFESLVRVVAPGWTEEFAKPDNTKIYVKELWILLVIEHVVLGMKALLSLTIDDSASWVRLDEDQSDEEEKKRMLGTTRQGEIDPSSLSLQTDSQTLSNKDSTNQQAGTDSSLKSSKFNEALAKQYAIALQQREEALQREQIAVQKLEEWMKCASITKVQTTSSAHVNTLATMELSPSGIIAQTIASSVNAAETRSSLKPLTTREELLVIRGHCFLCSALRDLKKEPAKRCLSCHVASCLPCDEILHLDDLGVNEAPHFRVKTFVAELHNQEYATGKLTYADMVDSHATALAKRKRERSAKYEELRQCVDNFVTKYRRSEDPARQKQTTDEVLERCSINVRVALRYLRNFERQQLYQNSSNPVVTSAHTTASVEPKKA
ncbi:hypothetical protein PHYBOEH_000695 [Phytophthora boehmeriae]|uniref:Anoctamin transmembrane domain-containing protein n=1 Tax=Phytophthora boehmeriae TaxID=109152 RepID=A0A8T1WV71_9STRA|nr:hypothetical protein PHYBOEH_000695 [Phytophthora boehmeriae]